MEMIWIIGAGKFGLRAAKWLLKQKKQYSVSLVDQDKEAVSQAKALGCRTKNDDAVDFLNNKLSRENGPDWIVPAVPVHLAWEWCRMRIVTGCLTLYPLPESLEAGLPNSMHGSGHDIYVSHADFLCPLNCNEPDDKCTMTKMPRNQDMFRLLAEIYFPGVRPFVIQSVQLGPGVGGYRPEALFNLLEKIEVHRGDCFVATACRCHGVVSGGHLSVFQENTI